MAEYEISGIQLAACAAGIKKNGKPDLSLYTWGEDAAVAAVFTQNAFCAAPVQISRRHLSNTTRGLLINAGNANAGTGVKGIKDAEFCCALVASQIGCEASQILLCSTGVIGEYLPVEKFQSAMPKLAQALQSSHWPDAAQAIMTTDTKPKLRSVDFSLGGKRCRISAIAKGAGMIRPNMATLLSFIASDVNIAQAPLQQALAHAVNLSYNRISVDGDTSTNDSCIAVATGHAGNPRIAESHGSDFVEFQNALVALCQDMAKDLVRDGEGATKLVNVRVEDAASAAEAARVAEAVAHSPLVKTALFAADPNWGRILAAVGRSGIENFNISQVRIFLDQVLIADKGARAESYQESQAKAVMDKTEFDIRICLGRGTAQFQMWTCDFSYDYVKINAEYRS